MLADRLQVGTRQNHKSIGGEDAQELLHDDRDFVRVDMLKRARGVDVKPDFLSRRAVEAPGRVLFFQVAASEMKKFSHGRRIKERERRGVCTLEQAASGAGLMYRTADMPTMSKTRWGNGLAKLCEGLTLAFSRPN